LIEIKLLPGIWSVNSDQTRWKRKLWFFVCYVSSFRILAFRSCRL